MTTEPAHEPPLRGEWTPPFAPLTLPRSGVGKGMVLVPSVGWYVACASCGHSLTAHYGDHCAWHDDGAGTDTDLASWSGEECPSCSAPLGDDVEDDDD